MATEREHTDWKRRIVEPQRVLAKLKPGMRIFLGTGVAEPRTLTRRLIESDLLNLQDLELIQIVGFGPAVRSARQAAHKYRYKTFFSGFVAGDAASAGHIDLIPCRFFDIPHQMESGKIPLDAAFVQISPPDGAGWCCLGAAVDAAVHAMKASALKIGEIHPEVPRTAGETRVHVSDFDWLVEADTAPFTFERWPADDVHEQLAANVACAVEDGSCIAFSFGPIFEALGRHLSRKRDLGVHSAFFTDALMDLVVGGAVTNRFKTSFPGRCIASYAVGTPALMAWLDGNARVTFHGVDKVFNPVEIGRNPGVVAVLTADKLDLTGRIALPTGKGTVAAGPEEALDFVNGAALSEGGLTVFALPSRGPSGESNIRFSIEHAPNLVGLRESVDLVATEYGLAALSGRTLRERCQALIDIAHPADRPLLVEQAKAGNLLYPDQMFLAECALPPAGELDVTGTFKNGVAVHFRMLRPSDEEQMRRLFYRFSDETVYLRYFSRIRAMPHDKMQAYVNLDCNQGTSIVALTGPPEQERLIAEARFVRDKEPTEAEMAFMVEEEFQNLGIASFLFELLVRTAEKQGIRTLTAEVLSTNRGMMTVFERGRLPVSAKLRDGIYSLTLPVSAGGDPAEAAR